MSGKLTNAVYVDLMASMAAGGVNVLLTAPLWCAATQLKLQTSETGSSSNCSGRDKVDKAKVE